MDEILFSVIIPTYNRPGLLMPILARLQCQSFKNWELIIMDDSHDSIASYFANQDEDRIRYVHRGQKLGVSSARNEGAALACGKYIIFFDDDDEFTDRWLADYHELVKKHQEPDLLYCGFEITDPKNGLKEKVYPGKQLWRIIFPGAFAISKRLFHDLGGYDERLLYGENTELFFRIRETSHRHAITDAVNYLYYQSPDGGSKNLVNIVESHTIVLEKHQAFFLKNRNVKKYYLRIIGVALMRLGRLKEARNYLYESFLLSPLDLKALVRIFVTYIPYLAKRIYTS